MNEEHAAPTELDSFLLRLAINITLLTELNPTDGNLFFY